MLRRDFLRRSARTLGAALLAKGAVARAALLDPDPAITTDPAGARHDGYAALRGKSGPLGAGIFRTPGCGRGRQETNLPAGTILGNLSPNR